MKKVGSYQIVDHGFEGEQYFQGCGLSFTEFEDVATGCGDTIKAAFEDALDSLAMNGWDVESVKLRMGRGRPLTVRGYLRGVGVSSADIEDNETHYYLSVRVKQ